MRLKTRRLALSGMLCALAEVILLLGGVIPIAVYACPILAMLALLPVREEFGAQMALAAYAAVALGTVLLCPDKELAGVFLFFGWYPALQPLLNRIRLRALRLAVKLGLFAAAAAALYAVLIFVFQLDAAAAEYAGVSRGILLAAALTGCATFLLTDRALSRLALLWNTRWRQHWLKHK